MWDLYDENSVINDYGKLYDRLAVDALTPIMDRARRENINLRELLEVINEVSHELAYYKILNWDCEIVNDPTET